MVKIYWTELAVEDLKLIHEYISLDSKLYGDKLIEKFIERVALIDRFPKSVRIVPEFNQELVRESIEGNYKIIYQISTNRISILRVHHCAR